MKLPRKTCTKCGVEKLLSSFYHSRFLNGKYLTPDTRMAICKSCHCAGSVVRQRKHREARKLERAMLEADRVAALLACYAPEPPLPEPQPFTIVEYLGLLA